LTQTGLVEELGRAITGAHRLLNEVWDEGYDGRKHRTVRHAIAHAAFLSLRDHPGEVFTGGSTDAAGYCSQAIERAHVLDLRARRGRSERNDGAEVQSAITSTVRDIFGNPFRPVAFDPAWRTDTAVALAKQMYESRDFGHMPILADALEDAGCDNEAVIAHCRDPKATHVRGCWVVDLVLGKG
jgi:hypothetical protein